MKCKLKLFVFLISLVTVVWGQEGMLTVSSDPSDIEVWLDDQYIGNTPIVNKIVKTGSYTIKLIDPVQKVSAAEQIQIQNNKTTTVEKTLEIKFGILNVESSPKGCRVVVYTDLGTTPLTNAFIIPGRYDVEIKSPDKRYQPSRESITIAAGKKISLTKTLNRNKILDKKAMLCIGLGAGCVGGYIFGLVQNGYWQQNRTKAALSDDPVQKDIFKNDASSNGTWCITGIVVGSLCIIGLEIVTFIDF